MISNPIFHMVNTFYFTLYALLFSSLFKFKSTKIHCVSSFCYFVYLVLTLALHLFLHNCICIICCSLRSLILVFNMMYLDTKICLDTLCLRQELVVEGSSLFILGRDAYIQETWCFGS
jgi:hypothetical protein